MPDFVQVSLAQLGSQFTDVSVASLTPDQASGAAQVAAADEARSAIFINPNANGRLYFTGAASADGPYFNLYADVPFVRTGAECPRGALFVTGQAAASKLRIGRA